MSRDHDTDHSVASTLPGVEVVCMDSPWRSSDVSTCACLEENVLKVGGKSWNFVKTLVSCGNVVDV